MAVFRLPLMCGTFFFSGAVHTGTAALPVLWSSVRHRFARASQFSCEIASSLHWRSSKLRHTTIRAVSSVE